jgi:hypothetical protein
MLIIIVGVLITATAALRIVAIRRPSVQTAHLGFMSEQWLAEQRAAHP